MLKKKLSILICSIDTRKKSLNRLLHRLKPQLTDEVEVLVEADMGRQAIGAKRNKLLKRSSGDYVCFIDDDDLVSYDYVPKILNALKTDPDCCGIEGIITFSGENPSLFKHSLKYQKWTESNGIYYRPPNHLNPIKRRAALSAKFPLINHREDRAFSEKVKPLLKTEVMIKKPIYFYLYKNKKRKKTNREIRNENVLSKKVVVTGDFCFKSKIKITNLRSSAAGIILNNSVLGFEGKDSCCMFVEGPMFKGVTLNTPTITYIKEGRPFEFKIEKHNNAITFSINNKHVIHLVNKEKKMELKFRPMRAKIEVLSLEVQ